MSRRSLGHNGFTRPAVDKHRSSPNLHRPRIRRFHGMRQYFSALIVTTVRRKLIRERAVVIEVADFILGHIYSPESQYIPRMILIFVVSENKVE
jgi:hypothetical protein